MRKGYGRPSVRQTQLKLSRAHKRIIFIYAYVGFLCTGMSLDWFQEVIADGTYNKSINLLEYLLIWWVYLDASCLFAKFAKVVKVLGSTTGKEAFPDVFPGRVSIYQQHVWTATWYRTCCKQPRWVATLWASSWLSLLWASLRYRHAWLTISRAAVARCYELASTLRFLSAST